MYDTIKVIRLSDLKDVKDFVRAAEDCDFEIDVKYNRTMIDAKSLLGMIGLGVQKDLKVCYGGLKTLKTLLRNSQWHNKISIETQKVSLRIRSGTFLVKEEGSKILTKEI